MKYELEISEKLLEAIKVYAHEMEFDLNDKSIDDFIVDAIVEKFNKENTLFSGKVDQNGFTDGRTPTEHFFE